MDQAIETLKKSIVEASQRIKNSVPMKQVLNEWEVVFLLGAIAKESNFILFQGSDKFPDATLEIMVNGQPIQIKTELEYRASHYDHDLSGCDLVICWRKDIGSIGNIPILDLYPLFPELDKENDNLEISHSDMDPALHRLFMEIEEWLFERKLVPTGTGSKTITNTVTFNIFSNKKSRSLCSLQYYNQSGYLQFKWFKDALQELGKEQVFLQSYIEIIKQLSILDAKSETDYEYRLNFSKNDYSLLEDILKKLDVVFEK
jgi:hypothetical protein